MPTNGYERLTFYIVNKETGEQIPITDLKDVTLTEAEELLKPYYFERVVHCKFCKYYHEDFWGEKDEPRLIISHQICSKWGGGCNTIENGYCHFGELRGEE